MWRFERDEADDGTHCKIASPKTMVIVFCEINEFHVIKLLSDAYHFRNQNEWNLIFPILILILNQSMSGFRVSSKYSRQSFHIHIHINNATPSTLTPWASIQNWDDTSLNKCLIVYALPACRPLVPFRSDILTQVHEITQSIFRWAGIKAFEEWIEGLQAWIKWNEESFH
jgi:hypothetical protein